MDPDATLILAAWESLLAVEYPTIAAKSGIKKRRFDATQENPFGGWTVGDPVPCFILSITDPEEIDAIGTFETVSVGYALRVDYVTAAEPGQWDEDSAVAKDIRAKRARIRALAYKPSIGAIANCQDVKLTNRKVYEVAGLGKLCASGMIFLYTLTEPRPE